MLVFRNRTNYSFDKNDQWLVIAMLKDQIKDKESLYESIPKLRTTEIPWNNKANEVKKPSGIYKKKTT